MAAGFPQSVQSRRESERQFPEWKPQSFSIMCWEWHRITSAMFYSIWSMCHIPLKDVALKPPHHSKAFDKLCLQNTFCQKENQKTKLLQQKTWPSDNCVHYDLWDCIHKVVWKPFSDVLTLPCIPLLPGRQWKLCDKNKTRTRKKNLLISLYHIYLTRHFGCLKPSCSSNEIKQIRWTKWIGVAKTCAIHTPWFWAHDSLSKYLEPHKHLSKSFRNRIWRH